MLLGYFAVQNTADQSEILRVLKEDASFDGQLVNYYNNPLFEVVSLVHENLSGLEDDYFASDEDTHWHLFFSGAIFNQDELSQYSNQFVSYQPASLLLSLFLDLGTAGFNRINGSFSAVLFNTESRKLLFVKDQVGTVPLSVTQIGSSVFFSFDTHSLARALFPKHKIDSTFIKSLFFDYERNYTYTPNKQLIKVLPGHYLLVENGRSMQHCYWHPEVILQEKCSQQEAVTKLRKLLADAVSRRCDKRFVAGAHMSGGLDSSLVAVLSRRIYSEHKTYFAFSWSPDESTKLPDLPFDERKVIHEQCNQSGLEPVFLNLRTRDYDRFVSEWRSPAEYFFEQAVREEARKRGVNLIFSGWGGDEFIGLRDEALFAEFRHRFRIGPFLKLNREGGLRAQLSSLLNNFIFPARRRPYLKYKIMPEVFAYLKMTSDENKLSPDQQGFFNDLRSFQLGLIGYYHIAQRCEDWYLAGQRMGLVYRYPMLDIRLIEYVLSLPAEAFFSEKHDRPLIRELASEYLIKEIWSLNKQGDPATMTNAKRIQAEAINSYKSQLQDFKKNPYLSFVNFDKVESELSEEPLNKGLKYLMHKVKTVHEYTINSNKES